MRPASVTTSEGRPTIATQKPLKSPSPAPVASAARMAISMRHALLPEARHDRGGEAHHRGDRQVDLAVDDDERHRQDHDRLLDAVLPQVDLVLDAQVPGHRDTLQSGRPRRAAARSSRPRSAAAPAHATSHRPPPRLASRACGGLVPAADPHPRLLEPPKDDLVARHREEDEQAQQDVADEVADADPAQQALLRAPR